MNAKSQGNKRRNVIDVIDWLQFPLSDIVAVWIPGLQLGHLFALQSEVE